MATEGDVSPGNAEGRRGIAGCMAHCIVSGRTKANRVARIATRFVVAEGEGQETVFAFFPSLTYLSSQADQRAQRSRRVSLVAGP